MKFYNKIAFSGVSGVGKDYLYSQLSLQKDIPLYKRLSFSDQLKKVTYDIFGDWINLNYPAETKEKPINKETSLGDFISLTPREIWLKMDYLRTIEPKIFIRMLDKELKSSTSSYFIITDVRTEDEFNYCKQNGFKIILIKSDVITHKSNSFDSQIKKLHSLVDDVFINTRAHFDINELIKKITY